MGSGLDVSAAPMDIDAAGTGGVDIRPPEDSFARALAIARQYSEPALELSGICDVSMVACADAVG